MISITIHRSAEWLYVQRLQTGLDIPEEVTLEVDPVSLWIAARQVILTKDGYRDAPAIGYTSEYELCPAVCAHGWQPFMVDALNPTNDQISQAILAAQECVEAKRSEWESRRAEKAAEQEKVAAARELLKGEFDALKREISRLEKQRDDLYAKVEELEKEEESDE